MCAKEGSGSNGRSHLRLGRTPRARRGGLDHHPDPVSGPVDAAGRAGAHRAHLPRLAALVVRRVRGPLAHGAPVMPLLWQAKSLKDFTRLEQARPAQAQELGNGAFRAEVRFGDVVSGYTDSRTLWDVSQHLFHEGDESWFGLSVTIPQDWIGWFPKNDELGNWPGNHDTLKGGQHGGSFFEWHHGPENGNWNDPNLGGSAPLYVVATDKDVK